MPQELRQRWGPSPGQGNNAFQGMGMPPVAIGSRLREQPPLAFRLSESAALLRGASYSSLPPVILHMAPTGSDSDMGALWGSLWQPHFQEPVVTKEKQGYLTGTGWGPREALKAPNTRIPNPHPGVPAAARPDSFLAAPPSPPLLSTMASGESLLTVP